MVVGRIDGCSGKQFARKFTFVLKIYLPNERNMCEQSINKRTSAEQAADMSRSPTHARDQSHRFAVVLSGSDAAYSAEDAAQLLSGAGCQDIRPLYENEDEGGIL